MNGGYTKHWPETSMPHVIDFEKTHALYFGCNTSTSNAYLTKKTFAKHMHISQRIPFVNQIELVDGWYLRCGFIYKMCIAFGVRY